MVVRRTGHCRARRGPFVLGCKRRLRSAQLVRQSANACTADLASDAMRYRFASVAQDGKLLIWDFAPSNIRCAVAQHCCSLTRPAWRARPCRWWPPQIRRRRHSSAPRGSPRRPCRAAVCAARHAPALMCNSRGHRDPGPHARRCAAHRTAGWHAPERRALHACGSASPAAAAQRLADLLVLKDAWLTCAQNGEVRFWRRPKPQPVTMI